MKYCFLWFNFRETKKAISEAFTKSSKIENSDQKVSLLSKKLRKLLKQEETLKERIETLRQIEKKKEGESEHDRLVRLGKITPFESTEACMEPEVPDEHIFTKDDQSEIMVDDGDERIYFDRIDKYKSKMSLQLNDSSIEKCEIFDLFEKMKEKEGVVKLSSKIMVPKSIWRRLFGYQRTGLKWLGTLFEQRVGGIIGDEMGLGKTIQIIGFISALLFSKLLSSAVLIIAPATLLKQWAKEIISWFPAFRVIIHHSSGSFKGNFPAKKFNSSGNIIITTYEGLRINQEVLLREKWAYVVLDEGHKIRNPDAEITLICKRLNCHNRILLSGTPIQNNLIELWSLFDFVFPGKLGTLPIFQAEFSVPISMGGYANASSLQIQTAYKCACILKDLINPYLLRRLKSDVAFQLPQKTEKVLFCKLTDFQKEWYKRIISSEEIQSIFDGKRHVLYGIDLLRKLCNHPFLILPEQLADEEQVVYSKLSKELKKTLNERNLPLIEISGKMKVLSNLLHIWKEENHKALIFCQTRQMLDIMERYANNEEFCYLRMDGSTAVNNRMALIDRFNKDNSVFIFLLTTKVGGLGVNLTGANRVIIFDPDWNPSTDLQARERVWRFGQEKDVTIYRFLTCGTIEEKIYHRQIYKQYLSNKILHDPKQARFFKTSDIHDLFSLSETSSDIFSGLLTKKRKTIENLAKVEDALEETTAAPSNDSHILESLFEISGLHSAMEHESVLSSKGHEPSLIEAEAEKRAQASAKILKQSRIERSKLQVTVPTWTGKASASMMKPTSSLDILHKIRERSKAEPSDQIIESSSMITESNIQESELYIPMKNELVGFFVQNGGQALARELMRHFRDRITAAETNLFRKILREIATQESSDSPWILKE